MIAAVALGLFAAAVVGTVLVTCVERRARAEGRRRLRARVEAERRARARDAEERRVRSVVEELQPVVRRRSVDAGTPRARVLTVEQRALAQDARMLAQLDGLVYDPEVWERGAA